MSSAPQETSDDVHAPADTSLGHAVDPERQDEPDTIEAGDIDEESDAGYATDSSGSVSTSIASSIRDFVFENGRRYHRFREGAYPMPNDEHEQNREDMKHAMIVNVCDGKLHYAPIDKSSKILDLGTGTGIWCMDMGDEYPDATILGIDLSPIQPNWVPPNVKFMVDDFESRWVHGNNHFDYVHGRQIAPIIKNLPRLISEAFRSIKPGGWVEFQELHPQAFCDDGTMPDNFLLNEWWLYIKEGLAVLGPDSYAALKVGQAMKDAGFINIQEKVVKLPIGPWAKDQKLKLVGMYSRTAIEDGLHGLSLGILGRGLHWSPEQVQVYLVGVKKALMDKSVHGYWRLHIIYGQKPSS